MSSHTVTPDTWVIEYENGIEYVENLNGIGWFDAPKPPRRHRCTPVTRAFMSGSYVQRCACGALTFDGRYWMDKNGERGGRAPSRISARGWAGLAVATPGIFALMEAGLAALWFSLGHLVAAWASVILAAGFAAWTVVRFRRFVDGAR